ncbi:MAG TPA: alpha-1,4-glucan--maltose-1-phosphate maltosyltransferase [Acidimicrobiales bacterium]|nr:alpha-1,4-glucan--maltose-1-phosphate maltosyltransferase [Acidimicrobiales bacterium]
MTGRIVIDDIRPRTSEPGFAAKAIVGEAVPVRAVIFKDGHDVLAARVQLFVEGRGTPESEAPLVAGPNDAWTGRIVADRIGRHQLVVQAWTDRHASWSKRVLAKLDAAQDVSVEIAEGRELLASLAPPPGAVRRPELEAAQRALADERLPDVDRLRPALTRAVADALAGPDGCPDLTVAAPKPLWVDRERALVGAWYELFPRSHGGFKGAEERVAEVAAMGFDVLYVPPIHPIGTTERKGRDNTLVAGPEDPGSPWAIGSAEGGHTSIHPGLGSVEDFSHFRETVEACGMELALDYALQCSPDHPWVHEHPEWFHHRPDGSIAYAENPPKKYQDIYPINFWPARDEDRVALWQACRDILEHWIGLGVEIFRVDNPHTKPVAFWEWLIPAVQSRHPRVVFLAEAFTRPRVMEKLAEIGFSQSYTYFTWRTARDGEEGLWAYLEELTAGRAADFFRPNFWPNTPDILSGPLRHGPPAAFALRYVLAATLSPSYGVYSGFELYENEPASEANEEYLGSEKYEIKHRDFDRPGTLAPLMTRVNEIRRRHPALQRLRNLQLLPTDNPAIFAYAKLSDDGSDALLVSVTLDPHTPQESIVHLDPAALGLPGDRPYPLVDLLSGERYEWDGRQGFVRFEPQRRVAHIFDLRSHPPVRATPVLP